MDVIDMWWLSLAVFAVVIVVVAVLLGLIIAAAKEIDGHAGAIWIEGKQIAQNTVTIWTMEKVSNETTGIRKSAHSMERIAASMEEKLAAIAAGRR